MPNHNPPDTHFRYSTWELLSPMMCTPNTLESPRMQQWHFRHVNMPMDNSVAFHTLSTAS